MAAPKDLFGMSDDELLRLAAQNSAAWHTAGEGDQAGLHAENVRINRILDSRRGETTTFDPDSGTWSPRAEEPSAAIAPRSGQDAPVGGTGKSGVSTGFSYESAPAYVDKYKGKIEELTRQILGRAAFEYDPETDPTYQKYKEQYTRSGKRAMQDTLGEVAARTGGLASSYAGSVAQQTYDNYMGELSAKIPELRQLAYQMYRDEGADQRANLEMLMALEQGDYAKYQSLLSQYNADRSFDYGVFSGERDFGYKKGRDALGDERYQQEWDYQLGRDAQQDAINASERELSEAADIYAATGDASRLAAAWGLSPESTQALIDNYAEEKNLTRKQAAIELAKSQAAMGDLSGYEALGWDTSYQRKKQNYDLQQAAAMLAKTKSGSKDTSKDTKSADYASVLKKAANYKKTDEAKSYLERMVDQGRITPDEAAYIFQVELGGVIPDEEEAGEFQGIYPQAVAALQSPEAWSGFISKRFK